MTDPVRDIKSQAKYIAANGATVPDAHLRFHLEDYFKAFKTAKPNAPFTPKWMAKVVSALELVVRSEQVILLGVFCCCCCCCYLLFADRSPRGQGAAELRYHRAAASICRAAGGPERGANRDVQFRPHVEEVHRSRGHQRAVAVHAGQGACAPRRGVVNRYSLFISLHDFYSIFSNFFPRVCHVFFFLTYVRTGL